MPMYDFQCDDCRAVFEELVRSKEGEVDVKCPECGSGKVRREISAPCVHTGASGGYPAPASGSCSPSSGFS